MKEAEELRPRVSRILYAVAAVPYTNRWVSCRIAWQTASRLAGWGEVDRVTVFRSRKSV